MYILVKIYFNYKYSSVHLEPFNNSILGNGKLNTADIPVPTTCTCTSMLNIIHEYFAIFQFCANMNYTCKY